MTKLFSAGDDSEAADLAFGSFDFVTDAAGREPNMRAMRVLHRTCISNKRRNPGERAATLSSVLMPERIRVDIHRNIAQRRPDARQMDGVGRFEQPAANRAEGLRHGKPRG